MTNLDKHTWALSADERHAIKWAEERGFSVTIKKRYLSKTDFEIEKDGVKFSFSLAVNSNNVADYMNHIEKQFAMYIELLELREQVKNQNTKQE